MATGTRSFNLQPLKIILGIIAVLWIVLFISWAAPSINMFGIRPRSIPGLIGIFTSPFLHGSVVHLAANTTGLFFLGLIFLTVERARAGYIIIPIYVLAGLGTWIIGRSGSLHIGASGVIYGLLGYLLFIGIFRRNFWTILMSVAIILLYGGALWGVLPQIGYPQISWEGHLSGFLAGILTAKAEANMTAK
ncbi:MAG TPA: rhomboid family intramembrane serine protease [Spirochaetota bacterium]|nr:rhomboid family intramembrane serine protease [Spirochaetota bacterium]